MKANQIALLLLMTAGACRAETSTTADASAPAKSAQSGAATARQKDELRLSGSSRADAVVAVQREARRQQMTRVEVTPRQSFQVVEDGRIVAQLLTGKGNMPDTTLNGCFVSTIQGSEVMLIPTLGYGDYEAEPCSGPVAVGILATGTVVKLGVVFGSYSVEAEHMVPLVIDWDRSNNTLLIDEELSRRALDSRATTILAMRKLVR